MSNPRINEFYFTIGQEKKGPFFSCPVVKKELSVEFNFSKHYKNLVKNADTLSHKFESRKSMHDKIINALLKDKKPSANPCCKFLITAESDIKMYKELETVQNIVLNFDLIARMIPEKANPSEILKAARKNKNNYEELVKFNDCCVEEQAYLFLLVFYNASIKNLDIILPGMFYIEPFEMVITLFNENKNYHNLEIYLLEVSEEYVDNLIKDRKPEDSYQSFMYKSYKSIFEIIVNDKSLLISRKPKIYRANLSDFIKNKEATEVNIEVIENELKKISGGSIRRYKRKTKIIKLK